MALYYVGCVFPITRPHCTDCPTKELGDVRSWFIVKNTFVFADITDPTEWATGIEAEDIYVFPATKGTVTPAANTTEGFGDADEEIDSYTYTIEVTVQSYLENGPFFQDIKSQKNFRVGWRTESLIHLSEKSATIIPTNPVTGKKDAVYWQVTSNVTQDDLILPQLPPVGVFEACLDIVPPA